MSRTRKIVLALIALAAVACGNSAPTSQVAAAPVIQQPAQAAQQAAPAAQSTSVPSAPAAGAGAAGVTSDKEFRTPPVKPGYQRFEPEAIEVPAGASDDWAQFVGAPFDQDYDVEDVSGVQSVGGHHALVYATTTPDAAGTTRLWKEEDQITARLMGGVGGEGGANVSLPEGIVFRVRKGSHIVIQTHYLNATDKMITGRTVIDLKLVPKDPSHRVASMLSSTTVGVTLAAHADSQLDVFCPIQKDLQFLMFSNHMHDWGTSTFTEFTDTQGTKHELRRDATWSGEYALNPQFTRFTVEAPALVPAGSMLHTHCAWHNDTASPIKFPTEMCVFFGFVLNDNDIFCTDNKWSEAATPAPTMDAAPPAQSAAGAAGQPAMQATTANSAAGSGGAAAGSSSAAAGSGGAAGSAGSAVAASGCTGDQDKMLMNASDFDSKTQSCALSCFSDPDVASCSAPCFERMIGLSAMCAKCNATNLACSMKTCFSECLSDSAAAPCRDCVKSNCDPAFRMCTGT